MRTINITYKDPNKKNAISKITITPKSQEDAYKTVTKEVETLTKKGIFSINIREKQQKQEKIDKRSDIPQRKDNRNYLKY